jgi:hypothetical protein
MGLLREVVMANIQVLDRVKVSSTSTGTGSFILSNTPEPGGFQNFSALDGVPTYYTIVNPAAEEWETGLGTFTQSTLTLARTTVYDGSNGTSKVNFSAGTKTVFCGEPASRLSPGNWMLLAESEVPTGVYAAHLFAFEGMGTTNGVGGRFSEYKVILPPQYSGWWLRFTYTTALTPLVGSYQTRIGYHASYSWYNYNLSSTSGIRINTTPTSNYVYAEVTIAAIRGGTYASPAVQAICPDVTPTSATNHYPERGFVSGTTAFNTSDVSGIEITNASVSTVYYSPGAKIRFYGVVG